MGEEGAERTEEEGDGGAECGVMESSVDAFLREAPVTPAQREAMQAEMMRHIVPIQRRYERPREKNVALQAAQRRSLASHYAFVMDQQDPAAPHGVGVDLYAPSFVKLRQANLPYSLTTLSNASMSLDVGVDQNATIMAKWRQAQQQFPHQIANCGHANKSVDQKATIFAKRRQAHQQLQQHLDHGGHANRSLDDSRAQYSLTTVSTAKGAGPQASVAAVQHQQERDRIQQEHFTREGTIAYFQHVGTTTSSQIARTGALRPALRANAERVQLLHATTFLQSTLRRRLVRATIHTDFRAKEIGTNNYPYLFTPVALPIGTGSLVAALFEQLELMRPRVLAATTIQRAWRRRGARLVLQHGSATKLVQSTSQVVRGCILRYL
jgi:hypothetical protein